MKDKLKRILLTAIVLFFSFQSIQAQDTLKHVSKHVHKAKISDTSKVIHANHEKQPVVMPTYPRTGYVAISGGAGLPVGGFASGGFATPGTIGSISAAFPGIISRYGVAFKFDYGINSVNQPQLFELLSNEAASSNLKFSGGVLNRYSYTTALTGLYLTYPSKKLTIDVRILAGVMFAVIPLETVNISNPANGNSSSVFYQAQSSGSAFAIDFGVEARYPVWHKFSVMLSMDYLHATPSYTDIGSGVSVDANTQSYGVENASQAFSLFNFSLGVAYSISAKGKGKSL
jgi:hypothetical protein